MPKERMGADKKALQTAIGQQRGKDVQAPRPGLCRLNNHPPTSRNNALDHHGNDSPEACNCPNLSYVS
jgi:hypothetical protein